MAHGNRLAGGLTALLLLFAVPATAGVVRFEITDRSPFADGHEFGGTGPYERIVRRVHYAIDPKDPANAALVDLQYAPRNEDGLVEFSTDLFILAPEDPRRGNGSLLYDVNNRGPKIAQSLSHKPSPIPDEVS